MLAIEQHRFPRLDFLYWREGEPDFSSIDALVATSTENLYYVTGFRSISHALFRGLELYGVFTRRGVGLVIPFIDATGVNWLAWDIRPETAVGPPTGGRLPMGGSVHPSAGADAAKCERARVRSDTDLPTYSTCPAALRKM